MHMPYRINRGVDYLLNLSHFQDQGSSLDFGYFSIEVLEFFFIFLLLGFLSYYVYLYFADGSLTCFIWYQSKRILHLDKY